MRIFLASADKTFRLALLLLLDSEPGMAVTGVSDRLGGLLASVTASQPDVLVLDFEVAKRATAQLVSDLGHLEDRPKIVVLSINPQMKQAALAAGADGFISKDVPPDELLPILRSMRLSGADPCPTTDTPA